MLEILIVFVVVSAVELVVVDFVVHRWWPQMRIPLLVLGRWGLILMFGILFGMLTLRTPSDQKASASGPVRRSTSRCPGTTSTP